MSQKTVKLMSRCDYGLKIINLVGAFFSIWLVYYLGKEGPYQIYVKCTACASIAYLIVLSGYGPLVLRSMSSYMLKFYIHRTVYVWLAFNLVSLALYIFYESFLNKNYYLIFNSVIFSISLSIPWALHILGHSSLIILCGRTIFWAGLILSFLLNNFYYLYFLTISVTSLQAILMIRACGALAKNDSRLVLEDLKDRNAFCIKEVGSRITENISNFFAASILSASSTLIFHAVMKIFSLWASFVYVPLRAMLRGRVYLLNFNDAVRKHLIIWLLSAIVFWLFFFVSVQYIHIEGNKINIDDIVKSMKVFQFVRQPIFLLMMVVVILHVYIKAIKEINIWPRISIYIEIGGIFSSILFVIFLLSVKNYLDASLIIFSHFLFLSLRDIFILYGYDRVKY